MRRACFVDVHRPPPPRAPRSCPTSWCVFEQAVLASLAEEFGGSMRVVKGEELLKDGDCYPMVSKKEGGGEGVGEERRKVIA